MIRVLLRTRVAAALGAAGAVLASCAAGHGGGDAPRAHLATLTVPAGGVTCAAVVEAVDLQIARRIYEQAAMGANVQAARRRLRRSRPLLDAVAAERPAAVAATLRPLIKSQIKRVEITGRNGRVLASYGSSPALAPVRAVLWDRRGKVVGHVVLAVASQASIAGEIAAVTGARTTIATAAARGAPSFAATAFPEGQLRIAVGDAVAQRGSTPAGGPCPVPRATLMAAIRAAGTRLLDAERSGEQTRRVLRHVAADPLLRRAVATADPALLRTAIVGFFRDHRLHVVRMRAATATGAPIGDVGGPYVLAPATTSVTDRAGRPIGSVTLSVQDDSGFVKLMHRFTGARVVLRAADGSTIPGSALRPGPRVLPASGIVSYRGRSYRVATLRAEAFPSGAITVGLLLPAGAG